MGISCGKSKPPALAAREGGGAEGQTRCTWPTVQTYTGMHVHAPEPQIDGHTGPRHARPSPLYLGQDRKRAIHGRRVAVGDRRPRGQPRPRGRACCQFWAVVLPQHLPGGVGVGVTTRLAREQLAHLLAIAGLQHLQHHHRGRGGLSGHHTLQSAEAMLQTRHGPHAPSMMEPRAHLVAARVRKVCRQDKGLRTDVQHPLRALIRALAVPRCHDLRSAQKQGQ